MWLQIYIVLFSGAAAYCVSRTDGWHRWGHILGLLSQPGYIYASWEAQLWGVFVMSLYFTWAWSCGIWRRFDKVRRAFGHA